MLVVTASIWHMYQADGEVHEVESRDRLRLLSTFLAAVLEAR
jgi:hypothetical protein